METLSKIKDFVKEHQNDIILIIGVILISLLSFAMGYIVAKYQEKTPLKVEEYSFFFTSAKASVVEEYSFFFTSAKASVVEEVTYAKLESSNSWSRDLRIISSLETV